MLTAPDAPLNFANVPSITTGSRIGVTWTNGLHNGGSPVIDYRISWNQGNGNTTL
jgi:hypothetical protein